MAKVIMPYDGSITIGKKTVSFKKDEEFETTKEVVEHLKNEKTRRENVGKPTPKSEPNK